jgi:uncharacterized membrane protein YqjE
METIFDKAGELAGNVKEYIRNRVALAKLEIAEKTSNVVALVIAGSVVAVFILLFLMFLGMGAATLLTELIGASYAGSLIVAGIYLLSAVLLWRNREKLVKIPVMNAILQQMFPDEEDQKQ